MRTLISKGTNQNANDNNQIAYRTNTLLSIEFGISFQNLYTHNTPIDYGNYEGDPHYPSCNFLHIDPHKKVVLSKYSGHIVS